MFEPERETCWVGVGGRGEVCRALFAGVVLIIHCASDLFSTNGGENGGKIYSEVLFSVMLH